MPRFNVIEIKYKTNTLLPCKEKRQGMTDQEAWYESAKQLLRIGREIRDEHKRLLNVPYRGTASVRGQYPRKRTGSLRRGIFCDPESASRIANARSPKITIGYSNKNASKGKNPFEYGRILTNIMKRKGIVKTTQKNKNILNSTWKSVEFRILNQG